MLTLSTSRLDLSGLSEEATFVARVSTDADRPEDLRKGEVFLWHGGELPEGYRAYVCIGDAQPSGADQERLIQLPNEFDYLADGDVVRLKSSARPDARPLPAQLAEQLLSRHRALQPSVSDVLAAATEHPGRLAD